MYVTWWTLVIWSEIAVVQLRREATKRRWGNWRSHSIEDEINFLIMKRAAHSIISIYNRLRCEFNVSIFLIQGCLKHEACESIFVNSFASSLYVQVRLLFFLFTIENTSAVTTTTINFFFFSFPLFSLLN